MNYTAVIFDLYGTLVDNFSFSEHKLVLEKMADILQMPTEDFVSIWLDTFNDRATGKIPGIKGSIDHIGRLTGTIPDPAGVEKAIQIKYDFTRKALTPRNDAVKTLTRLNSMGLKIGLISDCTSETPANWNNSAFRGLIDITIFSCLVKIKKPDPRIYQQACLGLEESPQNCLYIGDGSSQELTGARNAGLHPVLIQVPYEKDYDFVQLDAEDWDGPAISSLSEVLTFFN